MKNHHWLMGSLAALSVFGIADAADFEHACYPTEVMVFPSRVHVRCKHPEPRHSIVGNNELVYFAAPTSNRQLSDSLLQLGAAAIAGGKWLTVTFNDTNFGNQYGCRDADCRPVTTVRLHAAPLPVPPSPPNN